MRWMSRDETQCTDGYINKYYHYTWSISQSKLAWSNATEFESQLNWATLKSNWIHWQWYRVTIRTIMTSATIIPWPSRLRPDKPDHYMRIRECESVVDEIFSAVDWTKYIPEVNKHSRQGQIIPGPASEHAQYCQALSATHWFSTSAVHSLILPDNRFRSPVGGTTFMPQISRSNIEQSSSNTELCSIYT
jgi:hypothetical protein